MTLKKYSLIMWRSISAVDIDFNNAAGFHGVDAVLSEGQFITYYLSHALLFCMGTLIEPHVVLTPAICVYGEKYRFELYAGTHKFLRNTGVPRMAEHVCFHKAYNHTQRWTECSAINLAVLVLNKPYSFHEREPNADFIINRLRYGPTSLPSFKENSRGKCHYFGFGSRRNGYLIPLLINLHKVEVVMLPSERCVAMWNNENQFLCIQQLPCKSEKFGALCPDDVGSVIECSGYAVGMMVSRVIDRPCGIGFIDLQKNNKFLTCAVDDSRDVLARDPHLSFDYSASSIAPTPSVVTISSTTVNSERQGAERLTTPSSHRKEKAKTTLESPRKAIPEFNHEKSSKKHKQKSTKKEQRMLTPSVASTTSAQKQTATRSTSAKSTIAISTIPTTATTVDGDMT